MLLEAFGALKLHCMSQKRFKSGPKNFQFGSHSPKTDMELELLGPKSIFVARMQLVPDCDSNIKTCRIS